MHAPRPALNGLIVPFEADQALRLRMEACHERGEVLELDCRFMGTLSLRLTVLKPFERADEMYAGQAANIAPDTWKIEGRVVSTPEAFASFVEQLPCMSAKDYDPRIVGTYSPAKGSGLMIILRKAD